MIRFVVLSVESVESLTSNTLLNIHHTFKSQVNSSLADIVRLLMLQLMLDLNSFFLPFSTLFLPISPLLLLFTSLIFWFSIILIEVLQNKYFWIILSHTDFSSVQWLHSIKLDTLKHVLVKQKLVYKLQMASQNYGWK